MASNNGIENLFSDSSLVSEIKEKLPKLFRIAEIESSRAGKIGMEVGSIREKVIIALLIYKFGEKNVNPNLPITESQADVMLNGEKISIKTITGNGGVKAVWTVDAESATNFINTYNPQCDIILIQICWGSNKGGFFYIPLSVQKEVFKNLGKGHYLKMPKAGTNPRGVEFSKDAINAFINHNNTNRIEINWQHNHQEYNIYKRWLDYWTGEENLN